MTGGAEDDGAAWIGRGGGRAGSGGGIAADFHRGRAGEIEAVGGFGGGGPVELDAVSNPGGGQIRNGCRQMKRGRTGDSPDSHNPSDRP